LPRLRRIAVGNSKRISFENDINLELGSREVVTSSRGSSPCQLIAISTGEKVLHFCASSTWRIPKLTTALRCQEIEHTYDP